MEVHVPDVEDDLLLPVIKTVDELIDLVRREGPLTFTLGPTGTHQPYRLYPRLVNANGQIVAIQQMNADLPANICETFQSGTWWHGRWMEMFSL